MNRKMVFLCFLFGWECAFAQFVHQVLGSSGGSLVLGNARFDYVVGEMSIASFTTSNGAISEGFLQYFQVVKPKSVLETSLEVYDFVTPNNDGKNDFFVIKNLDQYAGNQLTVFNSYGSVVFTRQNYTNDWSASELPDGSYFYQLKVTGVADAKTGGFTVLR